MKTSTSLTWGPEQTDSLARVSQIDAIPGEFVLPAPDEARARLHWLGVAPDAVDDAIAGLPSPHRDPEAWALLERLYRELMTRENGPLWWPWPEHRENPLSRFFQLYVFIAALPSAIELHALRGVPDDISRATLSDVALSVEWYRRRNGRPGFNSAFWMAQHFRGGIFLLGRLQFNFWHVVFDPPASSGFAKDDPCLGVHIPALGRLDPDASKQSFAQARDFFPKYFPERRDKVATCASWLLDPQLGEYLSEDSNIIRFQRLFTPAPDWFQPGDDDVIRFVFGYVPDSLDELPQTTRMERAAVAHIKSGRHWQVRNGWVEL